jgi:hypothetical protein
MSEFPAIILVIALMLRIESNRIQRVTDYCLFALLTDSSIRKVETYVSQKHYLINSVALSPQANYTD